MTGRDWRKRKRRKRNVQRTIVAVGTKAALSITSRFFIICAISHPRVLNPGNDDDDDEMEVIKSQLFFVWFLRQTRGSLCRFVYLMLDTRARRKSKPNIQHWITQTGAGQSLYSKLFFMAIYDLKKSSYKPFVYSARLFPLLIDFLLHIMGIEIRIKWNEWASERSDAVSMWINRLELIAWKVRWRRWCNFQTRTKMKIHKSCILSIFHSLASFTCHSPRTSL